MSSDSAEHVEAGDSPDRYLTSTLVSRVAEKGRRGSRRNKQIELLMKTGEQTSGGGAEADRIISNVF